MKKYKCKDCDKQLSDYRSKRCHFCENRTRHKEIQQILTKEFLIKEYTKKEKSQSKIANKIGCSQVAILNYMKKLKIPIRTISEAHKGLQIGKDNGQYIDGRKKAEHYCIESECNNRISYNCWKSGNRRCRSCASKLRMENIDYLEENNPNWRDGISKLPYPFDFDNQLKDQIRKRDNYTCQLCSKTQRNEIKEINQKLSVHHIDYNKQNCNKDNLISVCHKCNAIANFNRNYWSAYFTYIMERK